MTFRRPAAALPFLLLASACAIAPPPPAPDPLGAAAIVEDGQVALAAEPAEAAFCVSQDLPPSRVELVQDGAAVRPAATAAVPDYALLLTRPVPEQATAWRLLVAAGPRAEGTALGLRRALADCLGRLGRTT